MKVSVFYFAAIMLLSIDLFCDALPTSYSYTTLEELVSESNATFPLREARSININVQSPPEDEYPDFYWPMKTLEKYRVKSYGLPASGVTSEQIKRSTTVPCYMTP